LFHHSPYSPYHAPNDYHLFSYLKNWLGSQRFNNNEEMEAVVEWLGSQTADFFATGIQNLFPITNAKIPAVNMYMFYINS
jgi:hypothetical protein